jgi:hypothetical protein
MVNFAHIVKYNKPYLSCNGVGGYCMGTTYVGNLTTSDGGKCEKNRELWDPTSHVLTQRYVCSNSY